MFRAVRRWQNALLRQSRRWWFAPMIGLLSALDAYVIVVPNETILVAAVTAQPKRWVSYALWATVGSAVGAASVAALVAWAGGGVLSLFHLRHLMRTHAWREARGALGTYGIWGLALISLSPLPQHAAVILAGLLKMKVAAVLFAVLLGRAPKYLAFAYLAAKAPAKLRKWHLLPKKAKAA